MSAIVCSSRRRPTTALHQRRFLETGAGLVSSTASSSADYRALRRTAVLRAGDRCETSSHAWREARHRRVRGFLASGGAETLALDGARCWSLCRRRRVATRRRPRSWVGHGGLVADPDAYVAQLTTASWSSATRRTDETISFWGGSEVIAPSGEALFTAPLFDEGLYFVDIELGDVRRERIACVFARRTPELHLRELRRILAERTGWRSTGERGPRGPVAPPGTARLPTGRDGDGTRAASELGDGGDRRGGSSSSAELAIDAEVARRVHGRVHPQPASSGRLQSRSAGFIGRIDSALVAFLVPGGRSGKSLVVLIARIDFLARVGRSCPTRHRSLGCAAIWSTSADRRRLFGRDGEAVAGGAEAHGLPRCARKLHGQTRMCVLQERDDSGVPSAVWRCTTLTGDLLGAYHRPRRR